MSKNLVLMRDLICKYHPEFSKTPALKRYGLKHSDIFNVERLAEECLAAVGGYTFTNGEHADFDDVTNQLGGTDCKTASIGINPMREGSACHKGAIHGVVTAAGGFKAGALRCIIYNPIKDRLDYYFLPYSVWTDMIYYHNVQGYGMIQFTYNSVHDDIVKLSGWECDSFEQLAKKRNC